MILKVYLDSVGCRLNQSEIEAYARQFRLAGYELVPDPKDADLAVINTCAVTAQAASDSRQKIRQMQRLGAGQTVVTGCWSTLQPEAAAHTLTAPRYPALGGGAAFPAAEFLGRVAQAGVTLAGGLYPSIRGEYFRIGHMGAATLGDILATLGAVEQGLQACGYSFEPGSSLQAAQRAWQG